MEIQATPFPGKSQPLKPKTTRKPFQTPKETAKEPPIHRQRRVFGTNRNQNIPSKTLVEKRIEKKPSKIEVSPKQPQQSPEKNKAILKKKKKSVCFEEQIGKSNVIIVKEGDVIGPKTPVVGSASAAKARVSVTPYQSAERCSKCRFDRLEESSYWISQIKLAESVGKHFVSVAFFRLALESKAEPIRRLRIELKRYTARHESLSTVADWRDVSISYGLIHAESNPNGCNVDHSEEQSMEPPETQSN